MRSSRKNQSLGPNLLQAQSHFTGELGSADMSGRHCLDSKIPDRPRPLVFPGWRWLVILMIVFGVQRASAQTTWSIGYYTPFGGYPTLGSIDWSALTHISFIGGQPNGDGTVTLSTNFSSIAPGVISAAHANGVKVLFCLTEITSPTDFTDAITNHESTFLTNIMSTVNTYGFDGVDVDDEETVNNTLLTTLFSNLRTQLGSNLLFSTAQGNTYADWNATLATYVDRVNIMTYVMDGTWTPYTWFNSALYSPAGNAAWSVQYAVSLFLANSGIPANKLGIGLAFFGELWTPNTGPRQTFGSNPTVTQVSYGNVVASYNTASATYDGGAHVPWLAVTGGWLNYDNPASITEKVNFAMANGLGGWIIWHLGSDWIPSQTPQDPLLDAVKQAFLRPPPPTALKVTNVN
jgi:chitinase